MLEMRQWLSMEHWRNNTDKENKSTRGKPMSVPLYPPQIPRGLESNADLRNERPEPWHGLQC